MSCDQAILVDQATDASLSSDAVQVEIGRLGQRLQRRGAVQGAVRPVLIVVGPGSRAGFAADGPGSR
jgi:hypothetical protein